MQWSLQLEEDGILGQEVTFSQTEKSIASERDYTPIIQVNVGQTQMQNSASESRVNSDNFQNNVSDSNISAFANQVTDNARQQANQCNYTADQKKSLAEAASEIQTLLDQFSQTYPTDTTTGRMQIATEAVKRIESSDELTQRILSAIKAGSVSAIEQFLNHPAASFVVAALSDWKNNMTDGTEATCQENSG